MLTEIERREAIECCNGYEENFRRLSRKLPGKLETRRCAYGVCVLCILSSRSKFVHLLTPGSRIGATQWSPLMSIFNYLHTWCRLEDSEMVFRLVISWPRYTFFPSPCRFTQGTIGAVRSYAVFIRSVEERLPTSKDCCTSCSEVALPRSATYSKWRRFCRGFLSMWGSYVSRRRLI